MNRWLDRWLTLMLLALLGWAGWSCLHWLWYGADWTVVVTNLPLYAVGSYPEAERWRPLLCIVANRLRLIPNSSTNPKIAIRLVF